MLESAEWRFFYNRQTINTIAQEETHQKSKKVHKYIEK